MITDTKVVVKGAGDLASGVIYYLAQAGFQVVATELAQPLVVRRTVSFAEAIYQGSFVVEGVMAKKAVDFGEIESVLEQGQVPILVDPQAEVINFWQPQVVVDATMAKRNLGTDIEDAPLVIALGPGFEAACDADIVIETKRGHNLGRLIYNGQAEANTGVPGEIAGYTEQRVLKSPHKGNFKPAKAIGEEIAAGEVFGYVEQSAVQAEVSGVIRGLLKSGVSVKEGTKLGDIDPRGRKKNCYTISDKARSLGGAILMAILVNIDN
ncbi:selenium-dependent molybdenum cofactor biosynthesis protein YqeB [Fuchsiella alkaliacetigena]|uniref:selenium-dependent molybdenum cofactor biosynthesis protein YqeB n=1 Tax=Fuchsiella alkaliacetigena TaxID=957042 RepID=UPI00200A6E67|nr:selenium-dependent molybdenum cofactor biosynthesis protein YqeB [Fuchsiella alkaliacetigena]MCK8825715.1 selenium-dependent molybdenum cofactor biosynthesis protein YqeB [Fuchsiella alkaliacetigena]